MTKRQVTNSRAKLAPFDGPVICPKQIGRDAQLDALRQIAGEVAVGSGQIVLVVGEAGIGKSRLVRELAEQLGRDGWIVQQGNCFERDRLLPYSPFLDAFSDVLGTPPFVEVDRDLERLFLGLGAQPTASLNDPEQEKHRIYYGLSAALSRMSGGRPLLLVVEDLHWADATSLELLAVLARRVRHEPILVLGTYRDDEVSSGLGYLLSELGRGRLAVELRLTRLTRDEVAAMLRAIFEPHQPVRQDLVQLLRAIYPLSEGNPFFVEELLRSLVAAGSLSFVDGNVESTWGTEVRLPRSVQESVRGRSERVSAAARQVLLVAAVAGRRFDFDLLQALIGLDETELIPLIKELIGAQLVVEVETRGDQFTFRHELTRQAVLGQLLGRERRNLHRRMGETIEHQYRNSPESRLEDLAYHFAEAGDWSKTLLYAERAGEKADALNAPASAVEHYARAIEAARLQALTVPPRLCRARGLAYERLGNFDLARGDHEGALSLARATGDRHAEWQALLDLGLLWAGRTYEQTRAYLADALDLARQLEDPAVLAHSLNRVGNWHVNVEQPAEGERYHREALLIFESLGDSRGIAQTLELLGLARYMQAHLVDAISYFDRAVALFRELDDLGGLTSALAHRAVSVTTYHSSTAATPPELAHRAVPTPARCLRFGQRSASPRRSTTASGHALPTTSSPRSTVSCLRAPRLTSTSTRRCGWRVSSAPATGQQPLLPLLHRCSLRTARRGPPRRCSKAFWRMRHRRRWASIGSAWRRPNSPCPRETPSRRGD